MAELARRSTPTPDRSRRGNETVREEREVLQKIVLAITEAFDAWQDQEGKMAFSPMWLQQNGYAETLRDIQKIGTLSEVPSWMPDYIRDAFFLEKKQSAEKFSVQGAQKAAEAAYVLWVAQDCPENDIPFSSAILEKTGYKALCAWIQKQPGGIQEFAKQLPADIQERFQLTEEERYTEAQARRDIRELYEEWRRDGSVGSFRERIAQHSILSNWVAHRMGWDGFLAKVSPEIAKAYEPEKLQQKTKRLTAAKTLHACLQDNRQSSFLQWIATYDPSLHQFFASSEYSGGIPEQVEKEVEWKKHLLVGIAAYLREYRDQWEQATLREEPFEKWFRRKEPMVCDIAERELNGIEMISNALPHIRKEKFPGVVLSPKEYVQFFRAHQGWRALQDLEEKPFDTTWLQEHGFAGVYDRITTKGSSKALQQAPPFIQADFKKRETIHWDIQRAQEKIDELHQQWGTEERRGSFKEYVRDKDAGLLNWIYRQKRLDLFQKQDTPDAAHTNE